MSKIPIDIKMKQENFRNIHRILIQKHQWMSNRLDTAEENCSELKDLGKLPRMQFREAKRENYEGKKKNQYKG